MPEMDGYEFMRLYSKEADTPTIILTARLEESDKVLGLELGADGSVQTGLLRSGQSSTGNTSQRIR